MYKGAELDSTAKNIVKELMRECINKNIPMITEELIIFYVKLLMLNPSWGVTSDTLPDRGNVIKFVEYAIDRLEDKSCPRVSTLRLQLYFQFSYDNVENVIIRNRVHLKEKLSPLQHEIMETQTEDKEELEKLFKKIIYLVTLYSGLGNPTIDSVYKEAEAALRSIFVEPELIDFMNQETSNKEMQIVELTELVTGIRLFNRDTQKGGEGIEDLPKLLIQAIEATKNDIQEHLVIIMEYVNMLTTSIDNCHEIRIDEQDNYYLDRKLPEGIELIDLNHNRNLLVLYRQKELFVKKILMEIENIEKQALETTEKLQEALTRVHETVQYKVAVPTVQVFPLFMDIASIWCQLQDQTIALAQFNQILLELDSISKDKVPDLEKTKLMMGPKGLITESERLELTNDLTIGPIDEDNVTVLYPKDVEDFDQLPLQYMGFCAWKLTESEGGLIPGNPNMGVLKVENMYYVFSCPEAAAAFAKYPIKFILKALELARMKPPLVHFLQLFDHLTAVRRIETLVIEVPEPPEIYDVEIQTDLHPQPTKIDPNYMWNIWDWKRQAILLANISKCATHSVQTEKSNAWNPVRTQTYNTREVISQTKKDNYTNVPTLSNYIYGLRGRKDDVQHIITLTRPVEEQEGN